MTVDIWQVLIDVVILLGAGVLLGALFERVRQSATIGYLIAGVIVGPNALHVIGSSEEVLAVSELGVALLLFVIGLEFSWRRLRAMGRTAFFSGALQVIGTTAFGAAVGAAAGLEASAAFTVGAVLALSSTACVLRVFAARGETESIHSDRALGILLVQDIAVVPFALIVSVLAVGGTAQEILWGTLRTAGIGLALVVGLYIVFNHVVPRLLGARPMQSNRELSLLVAVVSGLGSGVIAHAAGVSPALGAFLAGMMLAESPFAVQVRSDVSSLKTLLLTLFFTAMGMLTDPAWIASNALLVASVVVAIVISKPLIVWASLAFTGGRGQTGLTTGICLAQIGEFSFVLASIARGRLFDEDFFMLVVSATVITMILTPYLIGNAQRLAALVSGRKVPESTGVDLAARGSEFGIVIGYGPAGRAACESIAEVDARHLVVVDQNPTAARDARALGYSAVTGDARHSEVLDYAGIREAAFVVVTVPGADTALHIVRSVRQHAPEARILVRARFHRSIGEIMAAGAHVVVDEEHEVGRLIAKAHADELRRNS